LDYSGSDEGQVVDLFADSHDPSGSISAWNFSTNSMATSGRLVKKQTNKTNSMDQSALKKLIVTRLVEKSPAFYATRKFITVFTTARYWTVS